MSSGGGFIRLPDVVQITGLSKTTIYKMIREGRFPRSVPIYGSSVAWPASEVSEWTQSRIKIRDNNQKDRGVEQNI